MLFSQVVVIVVASVSSRERAQQVIERIIDSHCVVSSITLSATGRVQSLDLSLISESLKYQDVGILIEKYLCKENLNLNTCYHEHREGLEITPQMWGIKDS